MKLTNVRLELRAFLAKLGIRNARLPRQHEVSFIGTGLMISIDGVKIGEYNGKAYCDLTNDGHID